MSVNNNALSRKSDSIRGIGESHWTEILVGLGIDPRFLVRKHGPCPACGGKDRFRFDDREGRGTFYCNQCGAGNGYRLLQNVFGWSFPEALKAVSDFLEGSPIPGPGMRSASAAKEPPSRERLVNRLWSEATSIQRKDPVDTYLRRTRRIDEPGDWPETLRFHPRMLHRSDNGDYWYPAMVGAILALDGDFLGLQLPTSPNKAKKPI
jgi:putative DNA primase/helicase